VELRGRPSSVLDSIVADEIGRLRADLAAADHAIYCIEVGGGLWTKDIIKAMILTIARHIERVRE
jgi:hypothetical protein